MELPINLRSDTVTRPTPGMREAMARAEVGDDVTRDDPTVNRLEEMCAELYGMEASLFVPSGTMANQVAIKTWTQPGDELIADTQAHMFNYESAAIAAVSGVQVNLIEAPRGILNAEQVESRIRPSNIHHGPTRIVCVENTHNRGGGAVYPVENVHAIGEVAKRRELRFHMDGARLMNACVALGVAATEYTQHVDSATLCFSKGLGAPVGSMIAGSEAFIEQARRWRKMLGGGMRQAGIIAAGAIYALEHNVERLAEDHANAKLLAQGLADTEVLDVDPPEVETNIVFFNTHRASITAPELKERMAKLGVLMHFDGEYRMRVVTHLDVSREQILHAIEMFRKALFTV